MESPFGNIPRKPLTTLQRAQLFVEHEGVCVICHRKIDGVRERWIDEHITPLARGGTNDWSNRGPAHERCARDKTRIDNSGAAKDKRVFAKHIGARAPKGRPLPGSRASGWKRKMDGTLVRRDSCD